jgi:hypothetical protein
MKALSRISIAVLACLVLAVPADATPTLELAPSTETVAIGGTGEVTYTLSGSGGSKESYALFISAQPQSEVKCPRVGGSEPSWISVGGDGIGSSPFKETFTLPHARYENKGRYTLCAMRDVNGGSCEANHSTDAQCASAYATLVVAESTKEYEAKEAAAKQKAEEEREAKETAATKQHEEEAAKSAAERKATEEYQAKVKTEEEAAKALSAVSPLPAPVVTTPPAVALVKPSVVKPVSKPVSKRAKALKLCKKLKKHKRVVCEKRAKRRYKK